MGIIFMIIAAICFGWWGLTTVQQYWQSSMTSLVSQASQSEFMPSTPAITVDTNKMVRAINPPVTIDTRAAQRAAAESLARQIDQQNRAAMSRVPLPPNIPGMPRH